MVVMLMMILYRAFRKNKVNSDDDGFDGFDGHEDFKMLTHLLLAKGTKNEAIFFRFSSCVAI